eukprot:3961374-Prymnesium_polylepis.1
MRTVSAAGTAFRAENFSWRCGHFPLHINNSSFANSCVSPSCLLVLHAPWQRSLKEELIRRMEVLKM